MSPAEWGSPQWFNNTTAQLKAQQRARVSRAPPLRRTGPPACRELVERPVPYGHLTKEALQLLHCVGQAFDILKVIVESK